MRPRILTRHMFTEVIPQLLHQGLRVEEIAERLGCTVGTLKVRCSQEGVSLRAGGSPGERYNVIRLDRPTMMMLQERAAATGKSRTTIARELLETIARDNLYDAVLDQSKAA
jgi:IS30 family transposase